MYVFNYIIRKIGGGGGGLIYMVDVGINILFGVNKKI